jgi:chitodextrinase
VTNLWDAGGGLFLDGLVVTPAEASGPPPPSPQQTPAAPTNLSAAQVTATQINLSWKDNSDNETRFEIQRRIGSDWENVGTAPANTTTFQDPTVGSNIHSIYRVRAVNETSVSPWSDEASADTGSGAPPVSPSLSLNPSSLSFGDQLVGTANGAQSVLVQNIGQTPVEIRQVSVEGTNPGDFVITADGATGLQLLPGRLCIVNVRFLPTAAGPRSASLTITDTAGGSPHVAPLSGTGIAPAVRLSSGTLAFAEQPVGTTSGAQTVTITNTGTAPLSIPSVSLAGDNPGEFAIGTAVSGVTLAPGESRMLDVRFAPTRPGSRSATLVISDNAPGSPHLVTLSGTGTAPSVTFGISHLERPTKVSFGNQPVGTAGAAQTLTVTNGGAAPLTISSVKITGANVADFALSADSGGSVLAPGKSRQFTLRFKPGAKGNRSASLTLSDNAAGSPHSVALQGVGVLVLPKAPSGLALKVVSYQQIKLTWGASSADATAYAIWRKVGNGEFQRYSGVTSSLTHFVDQHVSPNTHYSYRVRANGPGGVSDWSNEVGGTTPAAPPVAPTGLTVRALSASQLELRWTDNSSDETGFAIWRKSGAGAWALVGGVPTGITRFVDGNLAANTTYSYEVRANGPGGVSGWSNAASGKTLSGAK